VATFTKLETPDVRALLEAYNLPELQEFSGIPAGSVNSNFEVRLAGTRVFLRVYEEQALAGAQAEARLIAELAARGVETPPPVARHDGALVSVVRGKPAAIFPWQAGGIRCQESVSPEDAERVGRALARVHVAGEGLARGEGRFRAADLRERLARIAAAPDPAHAAHAAPLAASLDRWEAARRPLPRGLVHGDLFRDNVLWTAEGEISALLDFESASDGVLAYDLMVTILAWCVADDLELELAQAVARGYTRVRPLSADEKRGLLGEGCLAAIRFSVTRLTDYAMRGGDGRVMKDYRRFLMRLAKLERIAATVGEEGFASALDL
jgi:homoserine kinase type II